jgi:hypothetical protein
MQVAGYAKDMERTLEADRARLEEVVKLEIRARISTAEQLRESLGKQVRVQRDRVCVHVCACGCGCACTHLVGGAAA